MQLAAYDNPSETLPLTQGQLGIWLAQMLDPEDASYNIGECIEIHGSFDSLSFERALRDVVASSDALHLKFFEAETGPAQYFDHELNWPLVKKDFSAELNPEQIARAWMQKDMRRPFRLYRTMLYRSALFRSSEHHHIWYGVHHHLINDGSGGRLLVKRVAEAYTALVSDAELPAPSVTSWREVVAEETSYKTSARRDRDRAFWKSQLANYPSPVTLSGKTPSRNSGYLTSTCYIPHRIDFASLARRHNATPAAVMAAGHGDFSQPNDWQERSGYWRASSKSRNGECTLDHWDGVERLAATACSGTAFRYRRNRRECRTQHARCHLAPALPHRGLAA